MDITKLNDLLTGRFLEGYTPRAVADVPGFRLNTSEGGALAGMKRPFPFNRNPEIFYPGLNDGPYGRKKKRRHGKKYATQADELRANLIVDPHVKNKRKLDQFLDLEPAHKQQKKIVSDFLAEEAPRVYGQPKQKQRKIDFTPDQNEEKVTEEKVPEKMNRVPDYEVNIKKDDPAPLPVGDEKEQVEWGVPVTPVKGPDEVLPTETPERDALRARMLEFTPSREPPILTTPVPRTEGPPALETEPEIGSKENPVAIPDDVAEPQPDIPEMQSGAVEAKRAAEIQAQMPEPDIGSKENPVAIPDDVAEPQTPAPQTPVPQTPAPRAPVSQPPAPRLPPQESMDIEAMPTGKQLDFDTPMAPAPLPVGDEKEPGPDMGTTQRKLDFGDVEMKEPPISDVAKNIEAPMPQVQTQQPVAPVKIDPVVPNVREDKPETKTLAEKASERLKVQDESRQGARAKQRAALRTKREIQSQTYTAVAKRMKQLGFQSPEVMEFKKPKVKAPVTKAPMPPLPPDDDKPDVVMRDVPEEKPKKPKPTLSISQGKAVQIKGQKPPKKPLTMTTTAAVDIKPVKPKKPKKRQLFAKSEAKSVRIDKPKPDDPPPSPKKPKKSSPKKVKAPVKRVQFQDRRSAAGDSRNDMKVAPTQQVSVNPTSQMGSAGMSAVLKKLDELIGKQKQATKKTQQKKGFAAVKKAYREARKTKLAELKKQHKEIKKRELAKIKKLPAAQRPKMRAELKRKLKERSDKIKKSYPAKVSDMSQMVSLVKDLRTLRV